MYMQTYHFLPLLAAILVFGAGCNPFAGDEPQTQPEPALQEQAVEDENYGDSKMAEDTALSNPATVYCMNRNGNFTMEKTLAGTTEGYCELPDGTVCEVWALYKGECGDLEEPEEPKEEEIATSTDDAMENGESTTGTLMNDENTAETPQGESPNDPEQTSDSEKKKKTGAIDIAVTPGEEAGEIYMSWDTHELEAPDGYIVMLSGDDDISYPTEYYHELEREASYSFTWIDLNPEKEYYFRVCIKENDGCGTYSPIISTYPKNEDTD
ncbi:DUF333 domain-containing protein [Candidatus Uhrbacteria bacterium]|nr:DUF333 domain-containing protein [Candidatus Uhrbacteria bacterium]